MLKEYLVEKGIQQKELAKVLKIDKFQMSKIANHKCMPTPEQAQIILDYLNCDAKKVFPQNFVNFKLANLNRKKNNSDNLYYRLCVKVNKSGCNCLKPKNLNILGYRTIKSWLEEQIKISNLELENYFKQIIDLCLNDIIENIKIKPQTTQEEQCKLKNNLMQKYFQDYLQVDELIQELINHAYKIVNIQQTILEQMQV